MTRALPLLAFSAALLYAQPPATAPKPEPPKTANLSFTVVDSITRLPLEGAAVRIEVIDVGQTQRLL